MPEPAVNVLIGRYEVPGYDMDKILLIATGEILPTQVGCGRGHGIELVPD